MALVLGMPAVVEEKYEPWLLIELEIAADLMVTPLSLLAGLRQYNFMLVNITLSHHRKLQTWERRGFPLPQPF